MCCRHVLLLKHYPKIVPLINLAMLLDFYVSLPFQKTTKARLAGWLLHMNESIVYCS